MTLGSITVSDPDCTTGPKPTFRRHDTDNKLDMTGTWTYTLLAARYTQADINAG